MLITTEVAIVSPFCLLTDLFKWNGENFLVIFKENTLKSSSLYLETGKLTLLPVLQDLYLAASLTEQNLSTVISSTDETMLGLNSADWFENIGQKVIGVEFVLILNSFLHLQFMSKNFEVHRWLTSEPSLDINLKLTSELRYKTDSVVYRKPEIT